MDTQQLNFKKIMTKTELGTELYNAGIKRLFEDVKRNDWYKMFESGFISFYVGDLNRLELGPVRLERESQSSIDGRFETDLQSAECFSSDIHFSFDQKRNKEFQEVSDFFDLCVREYEKYAIQRAGMLKVSYRITESEKEEAVKKVEEEGWREAYQQAVESDMLTKDSAKTETVSVDYTLEKMEVPKSQTTTSKKVGRKGRK